MTMGSSAEIPVMLFEIIVTRPPAPPFVRSKSLLGAAAKMTSLIGATVQATDIPPAELVTDIPAPEETFARENPAPFPIGIFPLPAAEPSKPVPPLAGVNWPAV